MSENQSFRQRLEIRMTDIAERLVASEGLEAVQARRVAQEADCSVGTIYNIFGGLDGLIIAANGRTLAMMGERLESAARAAHRGTLADRLLALALAYRDFAAHHSRRWRALFEHRMEVGRDVPDAYRAQQATLLSLVEDCLAGSAAETAGRSTAARALFSSVHGIIWLAHDNKLGPISSQETEHQIRFIVGAAARGLGG